MAEGLLNYTRLDDPEEIICTTQGRPLSPADEVRLVDEHDRDVPDGDPGLLLTRGPYTLRGYYRAAEHNARSFTADGWYRSGDICRRTPEGNLIVEGRDKDMINRGGEKISPRRSRTSSTGFRRSARSRPSPCPMRSSARGSACTSCPGLALN